MTPAVPAYFYPWPRSEHWARLLRQPAGGIVVVNPDSGPGMALDARYGDVTARSREAGLRLFGYVDSGYGGRPVRDLVDQALRHQDWYGVEGVFVDQTSPTHEDLRYYADLSRRLRARGLAVTLNPGQPDVDRGFLDVADALLLFEGSWAAYRDRVFPDWCAAAPPERTWHLVYQVPRRAAMLRVVELARGRGAGVVFATDGTLPNAWDHLPSYWSAQLAAVTHAG